jgi:D-lyxose ketol-isomerase
MKRSEINYLVEMATKCFADHGWALPPNPRWDVTDFGLGDWKSFGLVLVNLAEETEYCEKLMYVRSGMVTPAHTHAKKKEDIICRWGILRIVVWKGKPELNRQESFSVNVNGVPRDVKSGDEITLTAGERVTLMPGTYHEFGCASDECIIGEVSTANDDANDNFFVNPEVGRYADIDEDTVAVVKLCNE